MSKSRQEGDLSHRAQRAISRQEHEERRNMLGGILALITLGLLGGAAKRMSDIQEREEKRRKINGEFGQKLKQLLEIEPGTNRQAVVEAFCDRDDATPSWLTNTRVGEFMNDKGRLIGLSLDSVGEPVFTGDDLGADDGIEYVVNSERPMVSKVFGMGGGNHLVLYGRQTMVERVEADLETWKQFVGEFFNGSVAETKVLHMYYAPRDRYQPLMDINEPAGKLAGMAEKVQERLWQDAGTIAAAFEDGTGRLVRQDVIINFHNIHRRAARVGVMDLGAMVTETMANEAFNVLQHGIQGKRDPYNEAGSTLMGWLAVMDASERRAALGGTTYERVLPSLVAGMVEMRHS